MRNPAAPVGTRSGAPLIRIPAALPVDQRASRIYLSGLSFKQVKEVVDGGNGMPVGEEGYAIANYSFVGETALELSFNKVHYFS
jgi:hypothetical protein